MSAQHNQNCTMPIYTPANSSSQLYNAPLPCCFDVPIKGLIDGDVRSCTWRIGSRDRGRSSSASLLSSRCRLNFHRQSTLGASVSNEQTNGETA